MTFNQRLGARVRRYRTAAGVSQTQLANMLSALGMPFHQQGIVRVERGSRPLRAEELKTVANILGIDVSLLFYDAHDEESAEIEGDIRMLLASIAHERQVIAEREKEIRYYETLIQDAQERLRKLNG